MYAPNQIDSEKVFLIDKLCDILIYNLSTVTINQMQSCCKRHRMLGLGVTAPSGGYPVLNSFFLICQLHSEINNFNFERKE